MDTPPITGGVVCKEYLCGKTLVSHPEHPDGILYGFVPWEEVVELFTS